jgi:hypothetical protein
MGRNWFPIFDVAREFILKGSYRRASHQGVDLQDAEKVFLTPQPNLSG